MSTSHGEVAEPQVFGPLQMLFGVAVEQTSFLGLFLSFPSK